jgi:hypothetical protein
MIFLFSLAHKPALRKAERSQLYTRLQLFFSRRAGCAPELFTSSFKTLNQVHSPLLPETLLIFLKATLDGSICSVSPKASEMLYLPKLPAQKQFGKDFSF